MNKQEAVFGSEARNKQCETLLNLEHPGIDGRICIKFEKFVFRKAEFARKMNSSFLPLSLIPKLPLCQLKMSCSTAHENFKLAA